MHYVYGALFLAAAVMLLRWKRPALWAKLMPKKKVETKIHPQE